jgi:voltage-gated potassium channel
VKRQITVHSFTTDLWNLVRSWTFLMLTVLGNGLIIISGLLFYYLEHVANPRVRSFMDAIWWSFSTATTTGYGDITPITTAGKILGILLMLMGMALFAMYTGLFAEIILSHGRTRSQRSPE